MANVRNSNSIYVDATGALTTEPTKVAGIIFTPDAANDQLILKNENNSGDLKIALRSATAKTTLYFDFPVPVHFPKGVWVSTVTSGTTATIITTSSGG